MMDMSEPRRLHGGAMIAGALALLLLVPGSVFGANPFMGRWAVESFGQAEALVFEFTSDTEMLMAVGEEISPVQAYQIDTGLELLTLPMSEGGTLVLRYSWLSDNVFVLFMTEELLEQMVAAFTASLPNQANNLTDEIIEELRKAVRAVFATSPFMRATRLQ